MAAATAAVVAVVLYYYCYSCRASPEWCGGGKAEEVKGLSPVDGARNDDVVAAHRRVRARGPTRAGARSKEQPAGTGGDGRRDVPRRWWRRRGQNVMIIVYQL